MSHTRTEPSSPTRARLRPMLLAAGLTLLSLASGCSAPALGPLLGLEPVNPWEKGNLARPAMMFDTNSLETRYVEHIYTSREAASGGSGVGGGGCGCN